MNDRLAFVYFLRQASEKRIKIGLSVSPGHNGSDYVTDERTE